MKKLRLITYNIHKGRTPFRNLGVIERVRVSLRESDADILLLQEVVGERRGGSAAVERHLESLADQKWPYHAYGKNAVFPTRNHGNAILSSLPILSFRNFDLTIYPVEKRGLLHAVVEINGRQVHLCSVHLDLFELTRRYQLEAVAAYLMEAVPNECPLILGGDFNDWARKAGPALAESLGVAEYLAASFPSWHPLLALDRIYVRGIKVHSFGPLSGEPWNRLSDHLPLAMEFTVAALKGKK